MGRAPKRTFKDHRANPLAAPQVQGAVTQVQSSDEVPALLKKLTSPDANDRVWAAASASNLLVADNAQVRRMLLANNVIQALIDRLSDSEPDVVIQSTGALHSLAAIDQGAAEEISRKNIYAAIQTLIPRLASSIDNIIKQNEEGAKMDANDRRSVFLTTDNLISILWVLCETVPSSLKQINAMSLVPFLVSFFNVVGKLPTSLVMTAAQFLYTLTDDNIFAKRAVIAQGNAIQNLMSVASNPQNTNDESSEDIAVIRILAGGILFNVKPLVFAQLESSYKMRPDGIPAQETKPWEDLARSVLQVIAEYISFDVHAAAQHAAVTVKAIAAARAEAEANGMESVTDDKHEATLDKLNTRMSYVQLALELAANIFTDEGATEDPESEQGGEENKQVGRIKPKAEKSDDEDERMGGDDDDENEDDEEEDEDGSGFEDVDGEDDDFDASDMEDILGDEGTVAQKADETMQGSILGMFLSIIVPPIQHLAEPTRMSTLSTALKDCQAADHPATIKLVTSVSESFAMLHDRALGCFNNFLLVIEDTLKSWFQLHNDKVAVWWKFLIAIAEHLFNVENVSQAELVKSDQQLRYTILEPAIGCMWTLARCVNGSVPVTQQHIDGLIHVCETAPSSVIRIKAVGVLGNVARRQPGFVEENRRIGQYLLENVIAKPLLNTDGTTGITHVADAEPVIEALDLLYDVYSDQEFDYDLPVFVQGGFLAKLRQLITPLQKLTKTIDRRKHRSIRDRADLALQNLRGFVEYKASERKNH
ncbi:hypothetical protein GGI07_004773 [Coemansia sp. Benny D115]|nr:hypothetical protein GGI07_004773 [Coemansia sp. Benny D115]